MSPIGGSIFLNRGFGPARLAYVRVRVQYYVTARIAVGAGRQVTSSCLDIVADRSRRLSLGIFLAHFTPISKFIMTIIRSPDAHKCL